MGWDDDHLHRFHIHGRDYGIAYIGGLNFGKDAAAVPLSWFGFRPTAGWQIEVRVERVIQAAPRENHRIPVCIAGRQAGPPDGCGGPQAYAERRRDEEDRQMRGGTPWEKEIEDKLRACDIFVLLVSPRSMASTYINRD